MSSDAHSNELGEFLKARRVKGLRREEVALLSSISTDYYTRLEQGRRQASAQVLTALARVLRLDDEERAYMLELAGKTTARPRRQSAQKVQPQLRRLLDELTTTPALVLGRRMDILAWNPMAAALLTDFSRIPERNRNYAWMVFSDPAMKVIHADWENTAHSCVAALRMEAGRNPQDPRMATLVGELSLRDDGFRRWWRGPSHRHQEQGQQSAAPPGSGRVGPRPGRPRPRERPRSAVGGLGRRARHRLP